MAGAEPAAGGPEAEPPPALPKYVAIITDGNGRWAQQRGLAPIEGHEAGADVVKARLRDAAEFGIEELTVYSFSTENWTRPKDEVDGLMAMFAERIDRETPELDDEGVRMRFVGRRDRLDTTLTERMDWAEEGRVALRNIRRDVMHDLKELRDEGEAGADDEHRAEEALQKLTDDKVKELEAILKNKEAEILEV